MTSFLIMLKYFILLIVIFNSGCGPNRNIYVNEQGGVRSKSKTIFAYYKKNYTPKDTLLIDTNAVYVRRNGFRKLKSYDTVYLPDSYYRFYPNGRVQQVTISEGDIGKLVNNTEIGSIGYYFVKRGKLKMSIVHTNQTDLEFGYFEKGDILLFNDKPEVFNASYTLLKMMSGKEVTRWVKLKVNSMRSVTPTW